MAQDDKWKRAGLSKVSAQAQFDPHGAYYFSLEIGERGAEGTKGTAQTVAHFLECSGIKNSSTAFEIQEGGRNAKSHKRPDRTKWENIVLKYGTSTNGFLWDWRDRWLQDKFDLRQKFDGAITLRNNAGDIVKRYEFKNAWPVSWEGPTFNSDGSNLAVETLEIAHDGVKVTKQ